MSAMDPRNRTRSWSESRLKVLPKSVTFLHVPVLTFFDNFSANSFPLGAYEVVCKLRSYPRLRVSASI